MTSDARAQALDEEDAPTSAAPGVETTGMPVDEPPAESAAEDVTEAGDGTSRRRRGQRTAADGDAEAGQPRGRLSLPLVPTLAALLVLLLAGTAYLWFTRPGGSSVTTGDYAEALQAARSGVVDLTSFDYLTLDDDIEQIRRIATGDLREESVTEIEDRRQQITEVEAVVNTEVVGAGVTRADGDDATVLMVIQSTQQSSASPQAQISRYRIEVTLERSGDRWLLSGITGAGAVGDE